MKYFRKLRNRLQQHIINRLESPASVYEQRIYNNMDRLYKHIHKGDVVLVEGRAEISRIIKLFSQTQWSHSAFYVGDELIKKGRPFRERYLKEFGEDATHLVVEAYVSEGVAAAPLKKYRDHNIRVCRPYGISSKDLTAVVENVISNIGKHYDEQNIIDLGLVMLPAWLNPFKKRSIKACLGNCNDFQVICSGMIAKAFQSVGYPIIPAFEGSPKAKNDFKKSPYGSRLIMRHYSQILPRDFDLSPNFEVIKFNVIKSGKFEYKSLWSDEELEWSESK